MTDKIVVLSACGSWSEAHRIALHLVEKRVAACVNIVPGGRSVYRWKDQVEEASEVLLVIKTRQDLFAAVRKELASVHSYEVPEVLALSVVDGADSYLAWLDSSIGVSTE